MRDRDGLTTTMRLLLVTAVASSAACAAAVGGGQDTTWGRQGDNLLSDRTLQAVVDAQVRRDGQALVAYLGYEEPEVRARAAFALASVQDPRSRSALWQVLNDVDPRVRADVALALGQLSDTTGTRVLVETLREETDPTVRIQMIQAVGRTGGREAAALLGRTQVSATELPVFALALARIGLRGNNNALLVERLVELTGHEDPIVRRNAAFFFGRSDASGFWSPVVPRLREQLAAFDRGDQAAMWLLRALTGLRNPVDTDQGRTWLAEGTDWRVRHAAAELLRERRAEGDVTAALRAALDDPSPHVRESVAHGLAARGRGLSEEDYGAIETWIEGHPEDLRTISALMPAMVRHKPAYVVEWGERSADNSAERAVALRALSVLPDADAVAREMAAARGDGPAAEAALEVLDTRVAASNRARLTEILGVASEAVSSPDLAKVRLAASLLANPRLVEMGSVDALAGALDGADEPRARVLLRALSASEDPAAVSLLEPWLTSANAEVQFEAALGIEALTGELPTFQPAPTPTPGIDWARLGGLGRHPRIAFVTDHGEFIAELDASQAPLTVQRMVSLVEQGALDGVPFHRVVPGFVVQGGDVTRGSVLDAAPPSILSEFTRLEFGRGTLGMASAGKDTEDAQFFVNHLMTPHLNGGYTSFGQVISGQDVVDQVVADDLLLRAYVVQ